MFTEMLPFIGKIYQGKTQPHPQTHMKPPIGFGPWIGNCSSSSSSSRGGGGNGGSGFNGPGVGSSGTFNKNSIVAPWTSRFSYQERSLVQKLTRFMRVSQQTKGWSRVEFVNEKETMVDVFEDAGGIEGDESSQGVAVKGLNGEIDGVVAGFLPEDDIIEW